jgi:TPR repeat protein
MTRILVVALVAACGSAAPKPSPPPQQPATPTTPAPPPKSSPKLGMMTLKDCAQVDGSPQALPLYEKACAAKDAESCERIAAMYTCGKGVALDPRRAVEYDARACELDDVTACGNASMAPSVADVPDPARYVKAAEKGCAGHDQLSCAGLALMYLQGWGVTKDEAKAATMLEELCAKQGYQMACANVAGLAYYGIGMPKDSKRAGEVAESACKAGMPAACNTLGAILVERNGPGDARRAESLWSDLCNNGAAASCDNLGQLYRNGLGDVAVDLVKAKDAYDRACKGDNPPGCRHLAELVSQ